MIAIIAMLLAMILPSLKKVKSHAQSVICRSNLRQWGFIWQLYADDHDGKFPYWQVTVGNWHRGAWIIPLREYFPAREKMLLCPTASRENPTGNGWGGVNFAYIMGSLTPGSSEVELCSYGMNTWCANKGDSPPSTIIQNRTASDLWGSLEKVEFAANVPLMLDSMWRGGAPNLSQSAMALSPHQTMACEWLGYDREMMHFAIPRHHKGTINVLFADLHVDDCKLKSLWAQKWYHGYDTSYVPIWPAWMDQYD